MVTRGLLAVGAVLVGVGAVVSSVMHPPVGESARAAPTAPPTEEEQRRFTDALNRWIRANRTLALQIHLPFDALRAEATQLIARMRVAHSLVGPPQSHEWDRLGAVLQNAASRIREMPEPAAPDGALVRAARTVGRMIERRFDETAHTATISAEWSRRRATLQRLVAPSEGSWQDVQLRSLIRDSLTRFSPGRRTPGARPSAQEGLLARSALRTIAELSRRLPAGAARPAFWPETFDGQAIEALTALRRREQALGTIADLRRAYDDVVARRQRALTAEGSLREAHLFFTARARQTNAALAVATVSLAREQQAVLRARSTVSESAASIAGHTTIMSRASQNLPRVGPDQVGNIAARAATTIREAAHSDVQLATSLPQLAQLLHESRERITLLYPPLMRDQSLGQVVSATYFVLSQALLPEGSMEAERTREILVQVADSMDAARAVTSRPASHLHELTMRLNDLGRSMESVRVAREGELAQETVLAEADEADRAVAETLDAIEAIRRFEQSTWHERLPSPASTGRWSIAEARRIRSTLLPTVPGGASPSDVAGELPELPPELRQATAPAEGGCGPQ